MPRPVFITIACILLCAGLFAVGLWPLNFQVENHAGLLPDGAGLKFDAPAQRSNRDLGGMVFTARPLACRSKEGCEAGSLTIAVVLAAENESSSGVKRIVDLRRPDGSQAFYLGQWKSSLIVRSFNTPPSQGKPYREMGVGGVLAAGRMSLLAIVSVSNRTEIYVDGRLAKSYQGVGLLRTDETLQGHKLYLGNSPDLSGPWAGSILSLALFGKAWRPTEPGEQKIPCAESSFLRSDGRIKATACYRFDGPAGESMVDLSGAGNHLRKPRFLVFDKRFLGLPDGQSFPAVDLAVNLAGFMPFGFLVCLRWLVAGRLSARSCIFFALAAGFAVSLGIEIAQVWLPGRDSSLLDLGANSAGAWIGGSACVKAKRFLESRNIFEGFGK